MSTTRTFVIVGGGVAAAEAAKTLHAEGYADRLVVVTDEPRPPYERPPLTKEYLRGEAGDEKLVKQPASFYDEAGIELLLGVRAVGLDVAGRSLALGDGSTIRFDRLLLATGARAVRPRLDGVDSPWAHVVRTAEDADRLREAAGRAESVVVAGGGWIAAETAASLRQLGLSVTLVVPGAEVVERHLGAEVGHELGALHVRNGVRLVRSSRVAALRDGGGRREVVLDTGEALATDLAVLGLGAVPVLELARSAGLEVDDGILADEHLRTSADGVFAAGDVASAWNPRYADRVRSAHWDNARRQGRTAARNMLGMTDAYDRVPYFFSDQFDLGMEVLGRPDLGTERHLRRTDEGLVVAWTRDGVVVAGAHTNVWDSKEPLDRLIASGAVLDPAAFADPAIPLDTLSRGAGLTDGLTDAPATPDRRRHARSGQPRCPPGAGPGAPPDGTIAPVSKRTHVEDEVQRLRASRAAAEEVGPVAPAAAVFEDADRTREPGRGGAPAMARAIDGLHATAGNGAVAWLLGGARASRERVGQPQVRAGHAAVTDQPAVQRDDDDEETAEPTQAVATTDDPVTQQTAGDPSGTPQGETTGETTGGEGAVPLGAGAPAANPSWTKVGPPTPGSYSVSGSLRTVATAIAARTEAGSETATPSWQPQTWTPDGGTEEVISAQVKVGQVVELPVWSDKSSATKNQQAEWDRFHAAITTHEAGHVATDVAAFKGVHSKMLKKTESDADKELDAVIAQAKTDNDTYDTGNHRGIDQGTGINANIDEVTKVP